MFSGYGTRRSLASRIVYCISETATSYRVPLVSGGIGVAFEIYTPECLRRCGEVLLNASRGGDL